MRNGLITTQCGTNPSHAATLWAIRAGDLDCSGNVDFADINPFVLALTNPSAYQAHYPSCQCFNGDCNHDVVLDFADINSLVKLLSGE